MSTTRAQRMLKHEAELLRSFADTYRGKFEHVIDRLNQSAPPPADDPAAANAACIRLCVETLGMLLATQTRLADALHTMSQDDAIQRAA